MSFVAAHRDRFGVEPILRVLDIPVSTFYGWGTQQRDPCKRRRDDQALTNHIRRIHDRSGQTYGAPRVHAQLRRDGILSRRIVGWKASDRADVELVLGALEYAVCGRGLHADPAQRRLIHHSDRGAQDTAIRFTQRLADAGIQPSMGSVGDSFDNALAESFFSTLKVERIYRTSYHTRQEAELDLFRYIDGWSNPTASSASLAG